MSLVEFLEKNQTNMCSRLDEVSKEIKITEKWLQMNSPFNVSVSVDGGAKLCFDQGDGRLYLCDKSGMKPLIEHKVPERLKAHKHLKAIAEAVIYRLDQGE